MAMNGWTVTQKIEHAHALHPDYALYPGDLLVREADGARFTKEAPGLCISGFLLTAEEEETLKPVRFERRGLEYRVIELLPCDGCGIAYDPANSDEAGTCLHDDLCRRCWKRV